MKTFQEYPADLEQEEADAIRLRRSVVAGRVADRRASTAPTSQSATPNAPSAAEVAADAAAAGAAAAAAATAGTDGDPRKLPPGTVGLALSGGGIRSATFSLGVIQAMAARGLLRHVDWLSTCSGGGYVGAFLGRYYDRLRDTPALAPDMVETAVANPRSAAVRWLRDHGEYIAPAGKSDLITSLAIFLRNLLTVHLVLGLLLFGLYGLANGVRYGFLEPVGALFPYVGGFGWADMPIGHLVAYSYLGTFWSPWFAVVELAVLLLALPNALGYWLASQDEPEGYSRPALIVAFLALVGLLSLGVADGLNVTALLAAAPILLAFPTVEWVWRRVRRDNAAVGTGGPKVEQLRARTHLSIDLGLWVGTIGVLAYLAVIDTAGHALYEGYGRGTPAFARALVQFTASVGALLPFLRALAKRVADAPSQAGRPGLMARLAAQPAVAALLAAVLMAPPLLLASYASHGLFAGGDPDALARGWAVSAAAIVVSFVLALPWAISLVNRSSLQATYAARLARAYLGASNPTRLGRAADDVLPGDDVDTLTQYRPYEAGGPFHLINACVNQTVDEDTLHPVRDRRGVPLACSAVGVSLGRFFHARWVVRPGNEGAATRAERRARQTVEAIGHVPGTRHPLLGADDLPPVELDVLPLRDWVAISGAAFGPGMGRSTNPALAVLFLAANLRTGYWWDSGLSATVRGSRPRVSFVRRVLWLVPHLFQTQAQLLSEAFAKFRGPWERHWLLSDGGHFENLGAYELIRRRVPFIVVVDGGADPNYQFDDLANLQRRVRVDFGAELLPFGAGAWRAAVAADLRRQAGGAAAAKATWDALAAQVAAEAGQDGPFDRLLSRGDNGRLGPTVKKHAALMRVRYPDYDKGRADSLLLYVKASLSGDEPADVQQYRLGSPDFPHEGTADQFFGEAQWESYRRLGEHIGAAVLGPPDRTTDGTRDGLWLTRLG